MAGGWADVCEDLPRPRLTRTGGVGGYRVGLANWGVAAFAVTFTVGWGQGGFVPELRVNMVGFDSVADCEVFAAEITVRRLLFQLGCTLTVIASVKITFLLPALGGLHLGGSAPGAVRATAY